MAILHNPFYLYCLITSELLSNFLSALAANPLGLATEIMKPQVTDALKAYGIAVERRRSNGKRLISMTVARDP